MQVITHHRMINRCALCLWPSGFGEEEAKNKMAAVVSSAGGSADGAYHKLGMKSRNPNFPEKGVSDG